MKLAVLCCTYDRPHLLPHAIESFLHQDYPPDQREMIILDDNDQYVSQSRDGWHLVSVSKRFRTLGEKRNACAALASADVDAYVVWDDDDLYLPHALSAHATALASAPWSLPGRVLVERRPGVLAQRRTRGMFHSGWAFTRQAFQSVAGYPFMQSGQDQALAGRFRKAGIHTANPTAGEPPFLVYRWSTTNSWHLSAMDKSTGYERLAARRRAGPPAGELRPHWPRQYLHLIERPNSQPARRAT